MHTYHRRNRKDEGGAVKTGGMNERELVLHLKKDELLDSHVLLPHAEVNRTVYDAVKQFVEKYGGDTMQPTIMSDKVSELVQNIFKESYRSHYEDEYRKVSLYLKRRYVRAVCLLLISGAAFWCSGLLSGMDKVPGYIVGILGEAGVFCLWEIGYTGFARSDAAAERSRIVRARDAEIQFHCRS